MTAAASPMLGLLERLAAYAIARRAPRLGAVTVAGLAFGEESVEVELEAQGLTFLVNGRYRLEARVVATQPEETRLAVQLASGRTAGKLAQAAVALLPDAWLNPLLQRWLPGVRRAEGDYVVAHRPVAQALLRRALRA